MVPKNKKEGEEYIKALVTGTDFSNIGLRKGAFNENFRIKPGSPFKEIGFPGLNEYSGHVLEEFLPELQHVHNRYRVFREMSDNDATVGAMLYVIEQLLQNASRRVVGGDERSRNLIETSLDDMAHPWQHCLSEILTMLVYGFAPMVPTLKHREGDKRDPELRSRFDDGLIGWKKIELRNQESVWRWLLGKHGEILALQQQPAPSFETVTIPSERMLLFRYKPTLNSPEGQSLLRRAYRSWLYKKRFEEIEGIGVERELTGMPVLQPPENVDLWNTADPLASQLLQRAEDVVRNIRADQHQGVVLPFGWTLTLLASTGTRAIVTNDIISRLDQRIAVTVLADMLLIGQDRVGSFALVSAKTTLFSTALQGIAKSISDLFNRKAIPQLLRANGLPADNQPLLEFGPVETPDLKAVAEYINKLVGNQVMIADDKLEQHLREVAGFPPVDEDSARPGVPQGSPEITNPQLKPEEGGEEKPEDDSLPSSEEVEEMFRE